MTIIGVALAAAESSAREAGFVAREAFHSRGDSEVKFKTKRDYADIVTETDREVERLLVERLQGCLPASVVVGEEFGRQGEGPFTWYVDPIDGTSNFASGLPYYSVSIGGAKDGEVVVGVIYDPERDELFSADSQIARLNQKPFHLGSRPLKDADCELMASVPFESPGGVPSAESMDAFAGWLGSFRAVRRWGSCALHLAYVATGRVAVCAERRVNPWDIAAGVRLVKTAGGRVLGWDKSGEEVDPFAQTAEVYSLIACAPGFDLESSTLAGFPAILGPVSGD